MNRLAVVLAADSATTVTYWGEQGREERYFKGANKIFQLSDHHPVGVMIFDSADLLSVPWEVVMKEFRRELGSKSFNSVPDYAAELFSYINGNARMFPMPVQEEAFADAVRSALFEMLAQPAQAAAQNKTDINEAVAASIASRSKHLEGKKLPDCVANAALEDAKNADLQKFESYIADLCRVFGFDSSFDIPATIGIAITEVFTNPDSHLNTAGLVFAGFGDHDVFPSMAAYTSCGMLAGKHVHTAGQMIKIDHETPAWLEPFAQRDMADTFSAGLSFDVYNSTMDAFVEGIASFAEKLTAAAGVDPAGIATLPELIEAARKEASSYVMSRARKEHAIPMRRVLGALPVDELAELAETLINLQSLKEKVTKPSASVGGPVDVAAITKSEGLVWIKRKHYFDRSINSRYTARMQAVLK